MCTQGPQKAKLCDAECPMLTHTCTHAQVTYCFHAVRLPTTTVMICRLLKHIFVSAVRVDLQCATAFGGVIHTASSRSLVPPKRWYVPEYTVHSSLHRKSRSLQQHFDWNKGNELKYHNLRLFVSSFVKQLKEFWQNLVLESTVNFATLVLLWIFSVQHYLCLHEG